LNIIRIAVKERMVLASDKTTLPKEGKMDLDSVEGITGNQRMAEEGGMGF